jgi:DNA-binding HxlR family transcriptional regulator
LDLSTSTQLDQHVLDSCKLIHSTWNELLRTWTLPIIHALSLQEPARFNELKRRIEKISATSLAERLFELERQGIVMRKVYPETPPRVEYSLTERGKELASILKQLADWVEKWAKVQTSEVQSH